MNPIPGRPQPRRTPPPGPRAAGRGSGRSPGPHRAGACASPSAPHPGRTASAWATPSRPSPASSDHLHARPSSSTPRSTRRIGGWSSTSSTRGTRAARPGEQLDVHAGRIPAGRAATPGGGGSFGWSRATADLGEDATSTTACRRLTEPLVAAGDGRIVTVDGWADRVLRDRSPRPRPWNPNGTAGHYRGRVRQAGIEFAVRPAHAWKLRDGQSHWFDNYFDRVSPLRALEGERARADSACGGPCSLACPLWPADQPASKAGACLVGDCRHQATHGGDPAMFDTILVAVDDRSPPRRRSSWPPGSPRPTAMS